MNTVRNGIRQNAIEQARYNVVSHMMNINAIIQDIQQCTGPEEVLRELNADGRNKISATKHDIDQLEILAQEEFKETAKSDMLKEVENFKKQLNSTVKVFRKANIMTLLTIEKTAKEELLSSCNDDSDKTARIRRNKQNLVNMSSNVTENLLSISRHLAGTTQLSGETLATLEQSATRMTDASTELESMNNVIDQSGKLLQKHGRREFTDKILVMFAFCFFLGVTFYILQKRLF